MNHTPEPWTFFEDDDGGGNLVRVDEVGMKVIARIESLNVGIYLAGENGKRITSCVNALAGIESPAEFVAAAKDIARTFHESLHGKVSNYSEMGNCSLAISNPILNRLRKAIGED